jgi:hypothetical protein
MTDEFLETKEAFVKRLDGTFDKYESIVYMRNELEQMRLMVEELQKAGLRYDTIVLLLHDHTGIGKRVIRQVLNGLVEIPDKYFAYEED